MTTQEGLETRLEKMRLSRNGQRTLAQADRDPLRVPTTSKVVLQDPDRHGGKLSRLCHGPFLPGMGVCERRQSLEKLTLGAAGPGFSRLLVGINADIGDQVAP